MCPNEPDLDASAAYESERLRRLHDRTAGEYDRWMRFHDRVMLGNGGRRVCSRASGRTLKLAIGTGLNLPFYPDGAPLTGADLSPAVLAVAAWHVQTLGVSADLRLGDALAHDFPDDSFDTVVSTLFLSTVPDPRRAAAETRRVLKSGGQLLLSRPSPEPDPAGALG